jgi:5-methylcytosine-specific restriction endonuclease McrA
MALSRRHSELGTTRWKKTRQRVIDRDGSCVMCGAMDDLHADHIMPRSMISEEEVYDMENLQTLCRRCNLAKGASVKPFFPYGSSTPPVFTAVSLSDMSTIVPDSPFDDLNEPDCV